jgi:PadR family transcriptional regulator, regulatory protein PadR
MSAVSSVLPTDCERLPLTTHYADGIHQVTRSRLGEGDPGAPITGTPADCLRPYTRERLVRRCATEQPRQHLTDQRSEWAEHHEPHRKLPAALPSCGEWNIPRSLSVQRQDRTVSQTTLSLLQGTVGLLILRALQAGPAHGYAISRWIRDRTEGALSMEDAALYQALHRLEAKGWIEAEWGISENNRRAKYYALTPVGTRQLRREASVWRRYAEAMIKVLAEPV